VNRKYGVPCCPKGQEFIPKYKLVIIWVIPMNQTTRLPVISLHGSPLMPTTPARARKWIKSGKAIGKRNKVGVFYIQLLEEPLECEIQEIVAGTDRGKAFRQKFTQSPAYFLYK
jgi:hypothetical protein